IAPRPAASPRLTMTSGRCVRMRWRIRVLAVSNSTGSSSVSTRADGAAASAAGPRACSLGLYDSPPNGPKAVSSRVGRADPFMPASLVGLWRPSPWAGCPGGPPARRGARVRSAPSLSQTPTSAEKGIPMTETYRSYRLAARPQGAPTANDFDIETRPIPTPREGQAVLRTLYLSLDPYMRGRMDDAKSYAPPVEIGGLMVGATVSEVVATESDAVSVGDVVLGYGGWAEYSVENAAHLRVLDPDEVPVTTALGVLGMPGFTAYAGLLAIGRPQE